MDLRKQAIGSVKWTSVATVITTFMQLVQIAVLTRFLDKKDFGLMAMALFVIGISQIFIDMGMSNALIHKQRINKFQLSSLFWLNIIMGVIIFFIIILISPFIAKFYNTSDLIGVINWTAISFLILPWGQQFEALLSKDLEFKSLSIRNIASSTIGLVVAIFLAFAHFGVYALVYANLVSSAISTILLIILGLRIYRPQFIFSYKCLKGNEFFSFGLYQMGERLINYFNTNFDTILIGKLLGMEALGIYNIAKVLALKPYQILNPVITKVAFPVFSKIQNDIMRLKRVYLKTVNLIASSNAPVYIIMIVFSKPIVLIAFGAKWIDTVPILQLLAVGTLCRSIGNPVGSLQLARGRADWGFYWNLGVFLVVPAVIWIGSSFGLVGVAMALAAYRILIISFPSWYFLIRPLCHATQKEYMFSFLSPIFIAILAAVIPLLISWANINIYIELFMGLISFGIGYLLLSINLNKQLMEEVKELMHFSFLEKLKFKSGRIEKFWLK